MNRTRRALDHKPLCEGIIFVSDVGMVGNLGVATEPGIHLGRWDAAEDETARLGGAHVGQQVRGEVQQIPGSRAVDLFQERGTGRLDGRARRPRGRVGGGDRGSRWGRNAEWI